MKSIKKETLRKIWLDYLPMACTGVLLITFAIINRQPFFKTLPTVITLWIRVLLSKANRFSFLIGGMNCILYGISYFDDGLYFSFLNCVLFSAPIQIYSFFSWSKKLTANRHTELKNFNMRHWLLTAVITLAGWSVCYFGLGSLFADALLPSLDALVFTLEIIVWVLIALRFVNSQYICTVLNLINVCMWTLICLDNPGRIPYLVISFYNLYMTVKAAIFWTKQYRNDQKDAEKRPA